MIEVMRWFSFWSEIAFLNIKIDATEILIVRKIFKLYFQFGMMIASIVIE